MGHCVPIITQIPTKYMHAERRKLVEETGPSGPPVHWSTSPSGPPVHWSTSPLVHQKLQHYPNRNYYPQGNQQPAKLFTQNHSPVRLPEDISTSHTANPLQDKLYRGDNIHSSINTLSQGGVSGYLSVSTAVLHLFSMFVVAVALGNWA